MTSQEEAILAQVDAQLNAMDAPTSAEVFYGLEEFSPRHQVAAAARVAKAGGGGGGNVPFVGVDPPSSSTDGMLWWDPDDDTPVPSGGSQPIFVQKTLDSTDVLALFSAGAEIVASPGAGKVIVPISFSITYVPGGTPYTDHGGGIVLVTTSTGVQSWDAGKSGNGFWNTSDPAVYAPGFVSLLDADPTNIEDQPLMLVEDTADPTGGDGSLVVAVVYYVLDLT